tara:strand:+ start:200 stop:403 length:204 start_codon:yes stop_codon:yes gene_type:complete
MMNEKKATYTLWNGVNLIATYSHTREGMDAAMQKAHDMSMGGYGILKLYSSRDDLVWTTHMADEYCE